MRDVRIFRLTNEEKRSAAPFCDRLIVVAYSRSGISVRAWDGYSDKMLGSAGGYGYDKTHTALASAISRILADAGYKVELAHLGSSGFAAVAKGLEGLGLGYKIEKVF